MARPVEVPVDCAAGGPFVSGRRISHGSRPEAIGGRSARAARASDSGVVREPLRSGSQTRAQARLVAARRVPVDDALARHAIDQRDRLLQGGARAGQIVAGNRIPDVLQRGAQARSELAVVLAVLQTL